MGFWSRVVSAFREKGTIEEWFDAYGTASRSNSGVYVNQTTAMQATAVMACVRVGSEDVAKLPPRIYRVVGKGRQEATDHFLYRIFRKPNSWQTWFEFCEMMQVGLLLRGNAYAVVIRDGRGKPTQMVPVNPDRVMIYEAPDGEVFYAVSRMGLHETAVLEAFPLMIPSEDVFHLRWAPGINSLIGMSPIGYAREAIGYSLALEMHGANVSGNGARPSGVLQTDKKLTKDTAERLRTRWNSLYQGVANSGKTAVLEEGLKFQQLTMTSVDMEFIASRKFQVLEICRIFRVAPAKIGVTDGTTMRNIEQINLAHLTDTIHPNLERWEQKFAVFFDFEPDIFVEFDTSKLIRADLAARVAAARGLVTSAILKPDEARMDFGFNPEGGAADGLFIPANMVPIDEAGKNTVAAPVDPGPGSDTSGAPAEGGDGDPAPMPDVIESIDAIERQPIIFNVNVDARTGSARRHGTMARRPDGTVGFEITDTEAQ